MLILLVLEITLIQACLTWNKVLCTVQYFGNYRPWQHLLMDHDIEENYCINLQSLLAISNAFETWTLLTCVCLYNHIVVLLQHHCYKLLVYVCCLCLQARHTQEHLKNIDFEALIIVSIWINANSFDVCKEGKCLMAPELSPTDLEDCLQTF